MEVVLDLRCLQDPLFAGQEVGRYAEAVLRWAPRDQPERLTGLLDPALPPLDASLRSMLHGVRHTAYTGALTRRTVLVSLSPFTHDPLFTARLLHHPHVFGAAVVDNLLPPEEPGRSMPEAGARLDHHVSLRWLARHRLFLATHAEAGAALERVLGVQADEVVTTGAPADPAFDAASRGERRHVLVVANEDARREPEVAVLAHARSRAMQDGGIPLVVLGALGETWLAEQRAVAAAAGGRPELLDAPGKVDRPHLQRLYLDALCLVAPAHADGLLSDAADAVGLGIPVLASRMPAHEEVFGDKALFDVGDHAGLAVLLDQVALPWREEAVAAQRHVQRAYHPARVAQRLWDAVRSRCSPGAAPSVQRGARPRLALVLPQAAPDASYGQALCQALHRVADVDVCSPASEPLSPLPFLSSDYDRVVVFGDAGLAARRLLMRHGGAWLGDLNGALPDAELRAVAEPVLVHSPAAVRALAGAQDGALHLPYGLVAPAPCGAPRRAPQTGLVALAVLDAQAAGAALEDCVWALELLRSWGVDAGLHIPSAGAVADALRGLCTSLGVAAHVRFYSDAACPMEACVGLDVRAGTDLGAPVALVRGLSAGLRCITSASLVEAAGAPSWAWAVPDNLSPVRLAEAVLHALDQPPPMDAECQAYAGARSMDRTAAHLLRLLGLQP